uniref:Glycine-rich cell wall structural protein 1-like n=1 Tax=Castor canadensis TaxID=51338 RepID=A0A8B7TLG2_CASCN|nr:glycine-rich cell wall structural protein 1-like [Castor canadensis]
MSEVEVRREVHRVVGNGGSSKQCIGRWGSGGRCFGMPAVGVRREVLRDAGSGSQVSSAWGGVQAEGASCGGGVRPEVFWDARGGGQVGGASGCGQRGQARCALGGGDLAGGASGFARWGSRGRCFRMQVEGVRWEVLQDAPGGWGVMGEVLPDAGSGSQASSAGGWVRVEVLRAVGIRREVLWDAPGEGQVGGASGCGLLGQANCALGGGGFARGASGCTGRGSGGRCFRMGTAGDRREVLRDAGSGSQASSASEGGGQAEEASCGGGSGGKSLGGMPLVEVRWEVHRVVGSGVRQGVHWAVGVWREVHQDLSVGGLVGGASGCRR